MIALVDCNSFFCSVERVFHPGLRHRPLCVLSNNDGCIVALTPEAKSLGLRRGDPYFKVAPVIEANRVAVFSTNMMLYAAMSRRVTNILRKSVMHVENYSIDESFCYLDGYERHFHLEQFMRQIAKRILTWTDIPVSVGIAPSKTLAKMGSKFAKDYRGYDSVCMIDSDERRRKALSLFPLKDVWGIGRHTLAKLEYCGVTTPLEFADKSEGWVKTHLTLPGQRTWKELNGIPCIDTSEVSQKQSICTSRSFGQMVSDLPNLRESVATFAASCANKLRGQRSVAGSVSVFIYSNRFRDDLAQYADCRTTPLLVKTSDTIEITQTALQLLDEAYRPGIWYKKAGVILSDISSDAAVSQDLFDRVDNRNERTQLMKAIDNINHRFGVKSVRLAAEGDSKSAWQVKCDHRSQNYLTDLKELLTIHI